MNCHHYFVCFVVVIVVCVCVLFVLLHTMIPCIATYRSVYVMYDSCFFLKYFKFHNINPFRNFWSPYPQLCLTAATRLKSSGTCSCQCAQYFCTSKKWYGCQWCLFFSRCSCIRLCWLHTGAMLNLNIISINIKVMDKPCNDVIQTVGPTVSTALLFDD